MAENKNKISIIQLIKIVVTIVLLFLLVIIIYNKFFSSGSNGGSSSNRIKEDKIKELLYAHFTWNGIAETEEEVLLGIKNKVYIRYEAYAIAGTWFKDDNDSLVNYIEVDKNKKIVYYTIPEIDIKVHLKNDIDLDFIPDKSNIDIAFAREECKKDAENEIKKVKDNLLEVANENAEGTIKGLLQTFYSDYKICKKGGCDNE